MKFAGLKAYDAGLEAWVRIGEGVEFFLLSMWHPDVQAFDRQLAKEYAAEMEKDSIPPEVQAEMNAKKAANMVRNWRGAGCVDVTTGEPVPYSAKAALALMQGGDSTWLRNEVLVQSRLMAVFQRKESDALGKSSAPPSEQT